MASPGKRPRLVAGAAGTSTPADGNVVILNKNKPARMYSRIRVQPNLTPKVSDGDPSGTKANDASGPIILDSMSLAEDIPAPVVTAVPRVISLIDSPPPAENVAPVSLPPAPVVTAVPRVISLIDSPPPAEKAAPVSLPPAPEKSPQTPAAVATVLKRPLPYPNNMPPKMVIHVPKSLYKAYKEGKLTLAQLTEKAKKIQRLSADQSWPTCVAEKTLKEMKQQVVLPPKPTFQRTINKIHIKKSCKSSLQHVNELLVSDPVAVTEPPPVIEAIMKPKELHSVEKKLNTAAVVGQAHQVAPRLPIRASTGTFKSMMWSRLIPNKFRDWPVPASVLFAAAVQLKRNVSNRFTMKEKTEVETVLHLVGHYTSLGAASRCHVRERVHYYLKKLQSEFLNPDKTAPKSGSDPKQKNKGTEVAEQQTGGEDQNRAEADVMDFDSFFS